MYWVDVTDYSELRTKYERTRPVLSIFVLDSYEELIKGVSESEKSTKSRTNIEKSWIFIVYKM